MKKNKFISTAYTAIINTINSAISVILGLIFSKLLLLNYGSEMNGFISSITQFVSFFTILEGGFTTAAIVSIYQPLLNKKYDEVNDILYTAKVKYLRIGTIISILVLLLGSIYLLFIEIQLPYLHSFILIIICLLQTFLSISIESKYNILFSGDNKEYIITFLKLIARLIGWIISIVFIILKFNIILVYSTYLITSILNIVLIRKKEQKDYTFVKYNGKNVPEKIKGTNDLMLQKIANTVFNSTDIILISIIINFAMASVYSVYNLIYRSITQITRSFVASPFNSLGQLLNSSDKNHKKIIEISTIYDQFCVTVVTIILTITAICTIPFIKLYIDGVVDINYIDSYLVLLFFSNSFFQLNNQSSSSIINAAGNFKYQNKICVLSAIINIVLSIILAKYIGIYGILLGSLVSYVIIMIYNVIICSKKILNIGSTKKIIIIILNYIFSLLIILNFIKFYTVSNNYFMLILQAGLISLLIICIVCLFNFIINYKDFKSLLKYFINNKNKN